MDIAAWLRELGLERYEQAFRENDIDVNLLSDLTEADLEKLGVASLGHRKILLRAMEALRRPPAELADGGTAIADEAPPAPPPASRSEAERRQLTVMFVDLVGSTALSAKLDPEDMREVIRGYQDTVAGEIGRFEGHIAKFMGDGVLAYFGYPRAHEDEAERAVRAGLALVQTVSRLKTPAGEALAARVGIATGLVVVGDLVGEGAAQEAAVVGETPNLAARLQALAEPGDIVISRRSRRLVGGLFELADLGPQHLKGFAEPVRAWRVVGIGAAESRFEAMHTVGLTPLVGRENELGLLLDRWELAKSGEGQVVLLSGEPGIGKSRIVSELRARLGGERHTPLSHYCSPYHVNSALHPVIDLLSRAARFERDEAPEGRLHKLEAVLARGTSRLEEVVPLIAALLGIETGKRYPPLELTPERQKKKSFEALLGQLEGLAKPMPVLALYEDLHWADPSTLELLGMVVDRVQGLPVLTVMTFRPEFSPPWTGHAHVMQLSLSRLTRQHGQALVETVTGGKALPDEVLDQILAKTDGVPLFVEELTKTVLESGLLADAGDHYALPGPLVPLAIPATLQDSLMARLDRLAPVKEVAQIGAVIGRQFAHDLLAAVAPLSASQLGDALEQLVSSGLVFRRGSPPEATYSFKHALVQDAAYSSLLKSRRQQLHSSIAHVLEERFPETAAIQPELLAHHFTEARQIERATTYWLKAGELSAARSANLEAIRHLERGLEVLATLPESPERDRQELMFQIAIGTPLIAVQGYSAAQTGAAFSRARVLCERLGEAEPLVAALSGEFVYHFVLGNYPLMLRLTDEARQVSERLPDPMIRLAGHRLAGITAMHFGAFAEARSEFEAILGLYEAGRHRSQPVHYVHDPKVSALTYLALVLWLLGFPEQACGASSGAFQCAAELDQANLTAHVHNFAGAGLQELLRNAPAVREHADTIVELADRHDLSYWRVNGLILRGWAMVREGAAETGIALMHQSTADRAALGVGWYQARYLCMLAGAYAQVGRAEPGLRVVAEAKELAARNDEHMWESELDRIQGELLQVRGAPVPDIEACFARAMAKSREQDAKSLELRAATSLARVRGNQGKRAEAHDLLAPVYGWFTEGFDTANPSPLPQPKPHTMRSSHPHPYFAPPHRPQSDRLLVSVHKGQVVEINLRNCDFSRAWPSGFG